MYRRFFQQIVLMLRLRDRFLFHIIVKHVTELRMTFGETTRKPLREQERPCSALSRRYRP